ncbi:MAG: DNA polymerase III subunit delta' [Gammaproteobacteria bacterium]
MTMPEQSAQQIYPWQRSLWEDLQSLRNSQRLPHALLFKGARGLGKHHLAQRFAQALLCTQPGSDGQACCGCRNCLLYLAGNHPDFFQISPEEGGDKPIKVDQVRELNSAMTLKSHGGGYKIAIIGPAEQMNIAAANSLLKTLEEPPPQTLLMLISHNPGLLLPTIRSRCQNLHFETPPRDVALAWLSAQLGSSANGSELLSIAHGAPLTALALAASDSLKHRLALLADLERLLQKQADPVAIAAAWSQTPVAETLSQLLSWTGDMIRLRHTTEPPYLANPDLAPRLKRLAAQVELKDLYRLLDQGQDAFLLSSRPLNPQLLLEDVLLSWLNGAGTLVAST